MANYLLPQEHEKEKLYKGFMAILALAVGTIFLFPAIIVNKITHPIMSIFIKTK